MTAIRSTSNPLDQIRELNRAFLTYLKLCAVEKGDCLGLLPAARRTLEAADDARLDVVAEFPRALFKLDVEVGLSGQQVHDPGRLGSARRAIHVTIAFGAWTLCRQSVYRSRLLLALDSRAIQRLRALPIGDVHHLADAPRLVSCAFPTREWLWVDLLTEMRPEARRQLVLVALQPRLTSEWPNRRTQLLR